MPTRTALKTKYPKRKNGSRAARAIDGTTSAGVTATVGTIDGMTDVVETAIGAMTSRDLTSAVVEIAGAAMSDARTVETIGARNGVTIAGTSAMTGAVMTSAAQPAMGQTGTRLEQKTPEVSRGAMALPPKSVSRDKRLKTASAARRISSQHYRQDRWCDSTLVKAHCTA